MSVTLTQHVELHIHGDRIADTIGRSALVDARLVSVNLLQSYGETFHRFLAGR